MSFVTNEYVRATGAAALESRSVAEMKADLSLESGVDVQAYDAGLTSLAALESGADLMYYTSAEDVWQKTTLTSFARSLLDDTNALGVLTTLGLSSELGNLTSVEIIQLQAIGTTTISAAQWAILGGLSVAAKADYNNWAAFGDVVNALVALGLFDAA